MEKEAHHESMTTVNMKPEYSPSEYSASEPPPAYIKPRSSSVQIAKITAATVILCSVILGAFLLASAYVTANATCRQLEQDLEILSEAADRLQPLQPEALIQEDPSAKTSAKRQTEPLHAEEPTPSTKELNNHLDDDSSESESDSEPDSDDSEEKLPSKVQGQMNMDDLISHLLEKNQKSKMNCIVEKKKAEEFVDHQPKTIRLPFGINLTTNPRFEKLTGERMVIVCESGSLQSGEQPPKDPEDQDEETVVIQPMMIPIPHTPFDTHMPQQMAPQVPQRQGPPVFHIENLRPPMPPMTPQQQEQMDERERPQIQILMDPQQQQEQREDFPPNPILQHIVQQIVAQKIIESQRQQQEVQQQQEPEDSGNRLPLPIGVLNQLQRLPLPNRVIVAVSQTDEDDAHAQPQFVQEQRQSAAEMNGRQSYAREMPMSIPVAVAPQEAEQEKQETEIRPHYVQPRSV